MQSSKRLLILSTAWAVLCLGSCGPSNGSASTGAGLFRAHCAACHGSYGAGSAMGMGPTLRGVAEHWAAASLAAYLSDPAGAAASIDRLGSRPMPAWPDSLTSAERAALVDHTLGLMR